MTEIYEDWYGEESATLGDRIAAAREAAGLTQAQLSTKLGIKQSVLEDWENDRKEPRANRLQILAGLLGVSLRWLLTGVGEGPDAPDIVQQMSPDAKQILMQIRQTQAQIAKCAVRLGELEKQLRKALMTP